MAIHEILANVGGKTKIKLKVDKVTSSFSNSNIATIGAGLQLQPALKEKDGMHLTAIADNFTNH